MCGFLLRIIINAVVLFIVVAKLPGIFVDTLGGTLVAVAIVGLANAAVPTLLALASVPVNTVTLGGWTFFTNLFISAMVINMLPGFQISSFITPLAGIMLMTVCSFMLSKVIQDR